MESEIPKPSPSSEADSVDPGLRETWMGRQERNEALPVSVSHRGTLTAVSGTTDGGAREDCREPHCFSEASFCSCHPEKAKWVGVSHTRVPSL